jgi:hypothetical protein
VLSQYRMQVCSPSSIRGGIYRVTRVGAHGCGQQATRLRAQPAVEEMKLVDSQ